MNQGECANCYGHEDEWNWLRYDLLEEYMVPFFSPTLSQQGALPILFLFLICYSFFLLLGLYNYNYNGGIYIYISKIEGQNSSIISVSLNIPNV